MGMPHRGRLNVLANILNKPYGMIFGEFEGNLPETVAGDGDVKYHLGFSADHVTADKHTVHLSLTPNPSHLEAVNPVVEGRMRAKQRRFKDRDRKLGVPILIHGDAAFAGQGLVAETLNLSQLPGYRTGGTIHIVVNNQIGFTTAPSDGRSTRYCTDVAKMIEVPIFHVNGEDPEAVVYVAELALDFRETFGQDVVIDMVCYRRHGHNEGDEPAFTQPLMYDKIRDRISIRELYTEKLVDGRRALAAKRPRRSPRPSATRCRRSTTRSTTAPSRPARRTPGSPAHWKGLTPRLLVRAGRDRRAVRDAQGRSPTALATIPDGLPRQPQDRAHLLDAPAQDDRDREGALDWAFAETLAFGSLLLRRDPGPAQRPGQPPRHLQPAARRAGRLTRPASATSR